MAQLQKLSKSQACMALKERIGECNTMENGKNFYKEAHSFAMAMPR